MNGTPVAEPRRLNVRSRGRAQRFVVAVGDSWVSGVDYAELRAPNGDVGYAPLIVRPRRLGERRVAVVMPTNTWQAYNCRDADGDGIGDTWYAGWRLRTVDIDPPLPRPRRPAALPRLRPAVPALALVTGTAGRLASSDARPRARRRRRATLARAYDLIVFPGHHEYVTDARIRRRRALSEPRRQPHVPLGQQLLLAGRRAHGDASTRTATVARPRQARGGSHRRPVHRQRPREARGPVHRSRTRPRGHGSSTAPASSPVDRFGPFGIEIDATHQSRRRHTQVLAEIPHLFGPGLTAQMSYYETPAGAKVFAAGAFTIGGSALQGVVSQLLENLWARLGPELPEPEPPEPEPPSE